MNKFKYLLLTIFFFFLISQSVFAFSDIRGHQYEEAIEYLKYHKIIEGYPDGTYKPDNPINRAEFVKIIVGSTIQELEKYDQNCFPDIKIGIWYTKYICYAKSKKIIQGYSDGYFKPDNRINLVEAAKILVYTYDLFETADYPENPWYRKYIEFLQSEKYLPSDFVSFEQNVNRGQIAEFVWRIRESRKDKPVSDFNFSNDIHAISFNDNLPVAGNTSATCSVPVEALAISTIGSSNIVGNGNPDSCTQEKLLNAIAKGGKIVFNCGNDLHTIKLDQPLKIFNDSSKEIVIDGGGKIILDGQNKTRILYMNTCDPNQVWTTSHCDNQDHPRLTVQNLTFINANSSSQDDLGGAAIFARGGRLKILNSRFFGNKCNEFGQDLGGGAIRAFDQYNDLPLYIIGSTFGGEGDLGNKCANGGAVSSIGVSYHIVNSLFINNKATGKGANSGIPGGGNGGAVYNDGNEFNLNICGSVFNKNFANEGGGAIFFVSNNLTGSLIIKDSSFQENPSLGFETLKGIFFKGKGETQITNSSIN